MAERPLRMLLWYAVLKRLCQLVAVLVFRIRHAGCENIPTEGGVLVVVNHQSNLDPPLVAMACPRRMNFLAKEDLFSFPPFRWLIRSLDAIPLDRDGIGLAGIKESLRRLKRGEMVLVFPEGTRTRDGELLKFRPGFTALARRSGATILPVAMEGAYIAWPREQLLPTPRSIHLRYGRPISPEQVQDCDDEQLQMEVEQRVRDCFDQLRRHRVFARRT